MINDQKQEKSIIAQVSSKAYTKIMKYRVVLIGYQNCWVFDDFNDRICEKCGYVHSFKKCPRNLTCPKCAGIHERSTCTANSVAPVSSLLFPMG